MYRVFDGDEVLIAQSGHDDKGRPEGQVVEILSQAPTIDCRAIHAGGWDWLSDASQSTHQ